MFQNWAPTTKLHRWRLSMPSSFVLPQRMLSFPLLECCAGKRKFVYFCELWSKISVNINVLSCTYRLYLAAMHYNENGDRPQAETEEGVPLFKISFPKSRKRESAELNLKRHSRPLVRVQIIQHKFWIFKNLFILIKNQININTQ